MSIARRRVRRMKVKRKRADTENRKPFMTTKTRTAQVKDGPRKGEWRKRKTTKLRVGKAGIIASKSTDTKVGKAKRGDVVKRVVKSYNPPGKRRKYKITTYRQQKNKDRLTKTVTKSSKNSPVTSKSIPKKKIDRLKEAYRKVMRKKKRKKY